LISTKDESVLVDAPISPERGEELADWIEATIPGRRLTGIYVTHGHGDHFFAIPTIQKRFPGARVLATQEVYDHMLQQIVPGFFASFWAALFPDLEAPDLSDVNLDILDPSTSLSFYLSSGNGHHKDSTSCELYQSARGTQSTLLCFMCLRSRPSLPETLSMAIATSI
jgi:glyoxylase-like metal-dependent hydrolase (beta-lactamase superfamily II)